MRHIISFMVMAAFLSCGTNNTRQTASKLKQENLSANAPLVDTAKIITAPKPDQTKEQLWDEFWTKFSVAVNKRDKKAMIDLSLPGNDFFDGGGGGTAAEWINTADDETWKYWQKAITKGTKSFEETQRITKNDYMIFNFIDGRWVWTAVMGD